MRGLRKNCFGIGGFFEEMPVLIVVLVSLMIFLASFAHAYGSYVRNERNTRINTIGYEFVEEVRMWKGILDDQESTEGVVSFTKIIDTEFEELMKDEFHPDSLGFQYNVTFHDVSYYDDKVRAYAGTQNIPIDRTSKITINSPIVIVVSDDERHSAWMIVTIWGWD